MNKKTALRIFVITSGWVLIGRSEVEADGSLSKTKDGDIIIRACACVRRWGTTAGLGEIANGGPTNDTVIDPCPPVFLPKGQLIYSISCNEDKWKSSIPAA